MRDFLEQGSSTYEPAGDVGFLKGLVRDANASVRRAVEDMVSCPCLAIAESPVCTPWPSGPGWGPTAARPACHDLSSPRGVWGAAAAFQPAEGWASLLGTLILTLILHRGTEAQAPCRRTTWILPGRSC